MKFGQDPGLIDASMSQVSTSAVTTAMATNNLKMSKFAYTHVRTALNEVFSGRIIDPATLFYDTYKEQGLLSNALEGSTQGLAYTFSYFDDYSTYDDLSPNDPSIFELPMVGYTGLSLSKSNQEFNLEKEGFVNLLNHIAKEQPELKNVCNSKKETYKQLMELCKGNKQLLKSMIEMPITGESMNENGMLKLGYTSNMSNLPLVYHHHTFKTLRRNIGVPLVEDVVSL